MGKKPQIEPTAPKLETGNVHQKQGKLIFTADAVSLSYVDSIPVLEDITVDMRFGEKVVILGRNGSGKTSFLKLIKADVQPTGGLVKNGVNIKTEYIDQSNSLDLSMSPLEHFRARGFEEEKTRSILAQFHFTQHEAEAALKILSGGQQHRFKFLLLFKTNPEFIILDEPTNNLDPATWELLLKLINEFTGSVLLVSHDRSFVEQITDKRLWVLQNKTIKESWDELVEVLEGL